MWKFFRDPHLVHFWWNPWGVWTLIDIFQMCWILSEVYTQHIFDETLEKFGVSLIFSKFGIFQRSTLSTFTMKFLRSLVLHRYFLSVKFFKNLYLEHSEETLEKFDLSWIFSESGIFQRFTLSTFLMEPLRSLVFHRFFLSVNFSEVHT